MKKILFLIVTFICGVNICYASNHIYSIDSSIYIDEEGTATIKEVWNVAGSNGTEWYKAMYNLGNSKISDFDDDNIITAYDLIKFKALLLSM